MMMEIRSVGLASWVEGRLLRVVLVVHLGGCGYVDVKLIPQNRLRRNIQISMPFKNLHIRK